MAFVSSPSSTNKVNTAKVQVSTANSLVSTDDTLDSTANLSDATIYAFLANQPNGSQLVHEDLKQIYEDDLKEIDLKWQWDILQGNAEVLGIKIIGTRIKTAQEGLFMAAEEVPTNMALMAFLDSELLLLCPPSPTGLNLTPSIDLSNSVLKEFQKPKFKGYGPKASKSVCKDTSNEVKIISDAPWGSSLVSEKEKQCFSLPSKFGLTAITIKGKGWNMTPRAVVMKTGLKPLKTARLVNFAHPKTTVYRARPMSCFSKLAQSTVKRPYQSRTTLTNKNFNQKVNTAKEKVYTAKPKAVNTARPTSAVVNAVRANQGHSQKEDQGYVDSGCSRHMTGNMSYLSDFKEFDGGYVTFGGGARGGRITGKGTLKIGDYLQNVLKMTKLVLLALRESNTKPLVFFLASKDETSGILKNFITEIENLVDKKVKIIRCDNGTEFKNRVMNEFCEKKGIKREFSVARTPQQNGVAERRNRTLIEAARTMLADSKLPTTFWAEAVNTACYVQNRVIIVKPHNKTPYELFRGRTPALSFMRPFGCHVTILNTLDHLGKFDGKSDDGFFVGYSLTSKAFRVYNIRTRKVEENLHIRFLENKPIVTGDGLKWLFDIDSLTKSMNYVPVVAGTNSNDFADGLMFDSSSKISSDDEPQPPSNAEKKDDEGVSKASGFSDQEQPKSSTLNINTVGPSINTASANFKNGSLNINTISPTIITTRSNRSQNVSDMFSLGRSAILEATHADLFGDETEMDMSNLTTSYQTKGMTKNTNKHGFISVVYEGKTYEDLHTCLFACFLSQEEPKRIAKALSDPDWVEAMQEELLQNKKDERGIVTRNKARLVAQGYTQEEGIDYDEVFAPVARIEAIRLFLAYASFMGFMVYQMDMKSAFLYGKIEEEVYVCQPPGFEDPGYPDKVYKVVKALGKIDQSLFIKKKKGDILLVQMSSIGELNFLGLQVKQIEDGIFISQDKYVVEILRKFGFIDVRTASTPMDTEKPFAQGLRWYLKGQPKLGLWYLRNSLFDLVAYFDSDYARVSLDRKSKTGGCQFLRHVKRGRDTKIPQSSGPPVKVGDEAVHKELGDRMERAATTASSLEAEQDSGSGPRCQDTILGDVDAQTRFETTSKQSNDPPLSRGYTLGSGEDSMKLLELMELCTKLSNMLHKNRKSDLANLYTAGIGLADADISLVFPPHVAEDSEMLVMILGETRDSTADTALNTASVPISTASANPEVKTAAANLVYIKSVEKRKDKKEAVAEVDTAHVIDWNDPSVIRKKFQRLKRAGQDVDSKTLLKDKD
ncbi:putative ribonuclease H-like domain-containing protein [Tanacetum coccineum]